MRHFIAAILLCLAYSATAQLKYDANWVFGYNAGIDFNNPQNPVTFQAECNNDEYAGSISDASGRLLFYLANSGQFLNNYATIYDRFGQIITDGDSILLHTSCTNGVSIVPSLTDPSIYWVLHMGANNDHPDCNTNLPVCFQLYYSKLKHTETDSLVIIEKNVLLTPFLTTESMAITKNASGDAWWLIIHKNLNCSNAYYEYQIADLVDYLGYQEIGGSNCSLWSGGGEMKFDRTGNKLVRANAGDHYVEMLDFERCSGLLGNPVVIETGLGHAYGCEFSPSGKQLYVAFTENYDNNWECGLYSYSLVQGNGFLNRTKLWDTMGVTLPSPFQLELAPDGSIMFALSFGASVSNPLGLTYPHYMNLSRIAQPDSLGLACQFEEAVFPLGDSARSSRSLPHYPNYNLGPLPVFTATAGGDTVQCNSGSGITLGVPAVPNVLYQWSPSNTLSNTSIAQPIATPTEDTWYYLTATDTTATTCAVATDSVLVQVLNCVGIEELGNNGIHLYPNPATDQLYISLPDNIQAAQLELYSLLGAKLLQTQVHHKTPIDISQLLKGMYVYRLRVGSSTHNGKLLIE